MPSVRRVCKIEKCSSYAIQNEFCISHGGGARCLKEGCTKGAKKGGLCTRHGGGRRCSHCNCVLPAQTRALCQSHGEFRCKTPNCPKFQLSKKLCAKHGRLAYDHYNYRTVMSKESPSLDISLLPKPSAFVTNHGIQQRPEFSSLPYVPRQLFHLPEAGKVQKPYVECFSSSRPIIVRVESPILEPETILCSVKLCARFALDGGKCIKHGASTNV